MVFLVFSGHPINCKCNICTQTPAVSSVSTANTTTTTTSTVSSLLQFSGSTTSVSSLITQIDSELDSAGLPAAPLLISSVSSVPASDVQENTNSSSAVGVTPAMDTTDSLLTISNIATVAPLGYTEATTTTTATTVATTTATSDTTATDSEDITFVDYQPGRNVRSNLCQYCHKYFPADIIMHHKNLHFRERFFCCVGCGKNFRTEVS